MDSNEINEELLVAAKMGDRNAFVELVNRGVEFGKGTFCKANKSMKKHDVSEYIFILYDRDSDYTDIEMVTSDYEKAIEYGYEQELSLMVWLEGGKEEMFDLSLARWNLESTQTIMQDNVNGEHYAVIELMLPLIKEKLTMYEEERRKKEQEKEFQKRVKEIKELARLKAKYEK